jgi:hypothetical protein
MEFYVFESKALMKEVPPANDYITTTRRTSISSTGIIIIHATHQIVIIIYLIVRGMDKMLVSSYQRSVAVKPKNLQLFLSVKD